MPPSKKSKDSDGDGATARSSAGESDEFVSVPVFRHEGGESSLIDNSLASGGGAAAPSANSQIPNIHSPMKLPASSENSNPNIQISNSELSMKAENAEGRVSGPVIISGVAQASVNVLCNK